MIEVFDQLAKVHCKVTTPRIKESIVFFCNSQDSDKFLKAKAEEKTVQKYGKISFISVTDFTVLERKNLIKPLTLQITKQ